MILCISKNIIHGFNHLRRHSSEGGFFMGYFEISAPQVRTESNRVDYNITSKSGLPITLGPGPRYGDVKVMPIRDKDKCN